MEDRNSPTAEEYAIRIPSSFVPKLQESFINQPTPSRNLHNDFLDSAEEMQVYVRIKPCQDKNTVLSISGNNIIVQPPKDSVSFKNRSHAGTKTLQKFKFNKIYDSSIGQQELFKDSALHLVQDFLMGTNTLLFTYGATSAGKTYTMLGSVKDAGLIPRSLDVVFNSLDGKLIKNPLLKPLALSEVMRLSPNQVEAEEMERSILMKGFDLDSTDTKDSISSVTSGSIKDWNIRARDTTVCSVQYPEKYFSIWVSYCEIYNEQVFDLLDGCDKKKKRIPLRITEDVKGKSSKFYVKGLKEICVTSADDAVRVMLYGKENLHFAATKLNHNSSRSHCLFTVKLIRTDDQKEPTEASMNVMSFVDLAGMERTGKTESRGERLKEAGNINTSLMILGRCIDAMRNKHQNHSKVNIPYRESKLTRILQYFFSGQGRAAMFVNVSPAALLCDETLHVLKFGALAQEVIIQPDRDYSVADASISQFAPPLRPSRFQQYVRKSISILSASARASVLEPSFQMINEEEDDDTSARIQELEEELARMKTDWEEHEQKVRDECCAEWTEIFTQMNERWKQRYDDTKARYEEFCENRLDNMSEYISNCSKRKRKVTEEEEDLEHLALKFKSNEDRIDMLEQSNTHLTEVVAKLKQSLKVSEENRAELQKEMTKVQFESAAFNKPKINFCGPDSEEDRDGVASENILTQLRAKLAAKEEMLNEAVLEYHLKSEETEKILLENAQLKQELAESSNEIINLQTQLEKSNLLLSDANERLDVREDELVNLEEKLNAANGKFGSINTELRETKRKVRELESRLKEQTNASMVSTMCEELQKQLLEVETELHKREEEIALLKTNSDRASTLETREKEDMAEALETLRDQFSKCKIQLSFAEKELNAFKEANEDLKARRESLLDQISHLKQDFELCSTERKDEEGNHSKLLEENKHLRQNIESSLDAQAKLSRENSDFRKAMSEYESTIEELTTQIGHLKETQRNNCLLEEELKTLVATLSRVQSEKNQLEKDLSNHKTDLELMQEEIKTLKEENIELQDRNESIKRSEVELKEELQKLQDGLKSKRTVAADSDATISSLQAELSASKEKLKAMEKLIEEKSLTEENLQEKIDLLEKENETLNKDVLKHMRRANELSESIHELKEELRTKSHKCDSLAARVEELETLNSNYSSVQSQLLEFQKIQAIKEKEMSDAKAVFEELEKKEALIEQIKENNERVLCEKNQEINRLQLELKSSLTGFVDYKKPAIKIEEHENQPPLEDDSSLMLATPTPARTRRGRPKKVSSPPESAQKEFDIDDTRSDSNSLCGSVRSRRTIKTDNSVPSSSTKTSGRKPRKTKTDGEEVAHPALIISAQDENDASDANALGLSSKRRLYNAKCPDILLPTKTEELDGLDFPKRMATRSRKQ